MTRYVNELKRIGFVKPAISPGWVSALIIVPEKPPALFCVAIDYRDVNQATIPTLWPMPNIDAELANNWEAQRFALLDLCSGFWQASLHKDSQPLYAFVTLEGIVMPARTTQGGCNSASNFQKKVEPCFVELRDSYKAQLDDFMIFAESESELLWILKRSFEMCRSRRLVISMPKSQCFLK